MDVYTELKKWIQFQAEIHDKMSALHFGDNEFWKLRFIYERANIIVSELDLLIKTSGY